MAEPLQDEEKRPEPPEEARRLALADGTIRALAHLLAGTLRAGWPSGSNPMAGGNARALAEGLGLDRETTLTNVEHALRLALGMPPRPEGLPDCNSCGYSLGITPDGLCSSCAATAMLQAVLHPGQQAQEEEPS